MLKSLFIHAWLPADIRRAIPDSIIVDHFDPTAGKLDPQSFKERLRGKHGLVLSGMAVNEEMIAASAGTLEVIANVAVGYDNIPVGAARSAGMVVTNTPDVLTESTADMGFALLLATARRVAEADRYVRSGHYVANRFDLLWGAEISGSTIGIVGFGRIGQAVARRARGFGMRVVYHSRNPVAPAVEQSLQARWVERDMLFRQADFVVLCCPLTAETRHMVDARMLDQMKPKAYLVNIARGPVVDEAALVDALSRGRIAGAGLDVYEREPKLAEGLARLDNVVLTPHIASGTMTTRSRMVELAVLNAVAVLSGQPPLTPVT